MSEREAPESRVTKFRFRGYQQVTVHAGRHHTEHVVPCAGEEYAFDREWSDHTITISVSPTGRSVRVWIDGEEFKRAERTS
jgi:hypothetical protein